MKNFEGLKQNLESYLRKYYVLRMLRGLALFLGLLFCYFLIGIFTEYFLYMSEDQRKIFFFSGIGLALMGTTYYFIYPLLQILKLAKRSSYEEVAKMIGQSLEGVDDKILNTLQLGNTLTNQQSDLIAAAIEQKSVELSSYSFKETLSWKSLSRVALFLSLPVSLIVVLSLSTEGRLVLGSSERLLRYEEDFSPPAPFQFAPEEMVYWVEYGEDLDLKVDIYGSKQPTELIAVLNGSEYRLIKKEGTWILRLENITQNYQLQYEAMGYRSQIVEVKTFKSPRIGSLELVVVPPSYTGMRKKTISYSQNIKVLRGSQIGFRFQFENTGSAMLISEQDSLAILDGHLDIRLEKSLSYGIALENDYQVARFFRDSKLEAVEDKSPEIQATYRYLDEDSNRVAVTIKTNDDFGLSSLQRVEKLDGNEEYITIENRDLSFYEEVIDLREYIKGRDYSLYYQVADNNFLYGPNWSRSEGFSIRLLSKEERKAKQAKSEASLMDSFEELKRSREELNESLKSLENKKSNKQDWREEEKLKDLLKELEAKQKESKERRKDLEKLVNKDLEKKKELKEQLKVLSETEKQIEQLRKEIEGMLSKNEKEELQEKLKQLQEENKEQLRREERLEDLLKDLLFQRDVLKTIEEYKELSEDLKEEGKERESIEESKEKAKSLEEKLKELAKDSKELSDLMDKEDFKKDSEDLKENLDQAEQSEQEQNKEESKESKDKASKNASEMSKSLSQMMDGMQAKALAMNMKALRRILENLERYSVDVEAYKQGVSELEKGDPAFRALLKKGSVLSGNSKVIRDSLIALSEKAPEIKDKVFKDLNEMQYQLNSAQGHLQEVELMKSASAGQFSMMSANDLALLLDAAMQNMMSMMASKKKGKQNCEKPGGGKPKPGSMSEKLGKMGKMMEKLEKGSKPGSKGQGGVNGKSIGQVLSEQESLRQTLKEMDKEGSKENGEGKPLEQELDEMEDLLLERNFSEYIERFKRVESRLLESEKANMERKKKEERESKSSKELEMREGKADLLDPGERTRQNDILRLSPLLINPFYQKG